MSKLNPQKATAYVGPGVLRKGGKITPVPNGPLIKKKGKYAGSTLKAGGKIKKAQDGLDTLYTKKDKVGNVRTNKYVGRMPNGNLEMGKVIKTKDDKGKTTTVKEATQSFHLGRRFTDDEIRKSMNSQKNGGMIKRADGSYSKRGLWDNIRANKGSGKKPTKQMLQQEKKIKATAKDGKWIQKAVNPAHKGYCTPMTKATCTPKRKALAKTFKAMAKNRKK